MGVRIDVSNVSRVKFPNRFKVALALVRVLIERRVVDGVPVWDTCEETENEGSGNGSCKGDSEGCCVGSMRVRRRIDMGRWRR
jgi:hypothetical protein